MTSSTRYLQSQVEEDLTEKMVFLGGPRQVGKTTLALQVLKKGNGYLNWDVAPDREKILKRELPVAPLLVFDEIHKYRSWRNYLKGLYDQSREKRKILVTGSARLDFYRFGGDSLQGRYHYLRLHPLSTAELRLKNTNELSTLLELGGFPEPFFRQNRTKARRWSLEYRERLIREDISSLEGVHDLGNMELLMLRLPQLVGSPLSVNALREDLQLNHKTVTRWLVIFERLYAIFRLSPFGSPKLRAVKKEQKHYHFDWTLVPDESFRFENMVASHLLKYVHFLRDTEGRETSLSYFREVTGREVDFVVAGGGKPLTFVECKWADAPINSALYYLKERFPKADCWQISMMGKKDFLSPEGIRVCPALEFLKDLV